MLLAFGTIGACLLMPVLAEKLGRRGALGVFYVTMGVAISSAFGFAFHRPAPALPLFIGWLFFVGAGGGAFALYWVWLAEQYRTECRGSALALATCVGRFVAAGATFLIGLGISKYGSIGTPVAFTAIPFFVGVSLLPLGTETRGRPLPP
jgi:MFS family permease